MEGNRMPYHPPRQIAPKPSGLPLEIDLVYAVRPCGTCSFFWPDDPSKQPYGPYPAFDVESNEPKGADPPAGAVSFPWLQAITRPECFPEPEVMDGCRKAPIMTIGINPNLTAFSPGTSGTSWCYPSFSSDGGTDEWTKYAYYYRYRSVYQERFDLDYVKQFLLPEPRVVAPRAGTVVSAQRTSSSPSYELTVRYDGDHEDTTIPLDRDSGTPRWVLLVDPHPPNNRFAAGALLAARLDVPAGQRTQLYREQEGYYEQFVPVLSQFQAYLRGQGHGDASLAMGEDVCQLDMVACASPHWKPDYLGGSRESEDTIIDNCVSKNAWAMRQLVQTRPAVLYLVGESSYDMFHRAFGALIRREPSLSRYPRDGAFTLLRETTDRERPCWFEFSTTIDGTAYHLKTRLVLTPHFSYNSNFTPQFRLSPEDWQQLQQNEPAVAQMLQQDPRVVYVPGAKKEDFTAFLVQDGADAVLADVANQSADAAALLKKNFYDPHRMMNDVLEDLYSQGLLRYGPVRDGGSQALVRTEGACHFCVNERWEFPEGCPYGKIDEPAPAAGFLERVTAELVAAGKPTSTGS